MKNKKYIIIVIIAVAAAIGLYLALVGTGEKLLKIPADYDRIVVIRADSNEIRYPEDGEKMENGYADAYNYKTMYTATGDAAKTIADYLNSSKYLRRKSINVFTFVPGISMDSVGTHDRVSYYILFENAEGETVYSLSTTGCDYIVSGTEGDINKKILDRKWQQHFDTVLENAQQKENYWSPDVTWFKEIQWAD